MNIFYKKLELNELSVVLFDSFNRYQEVKKCWRKENGQWQLNDISFIEQWDAPEKEKLTKCLLNTILTEGAVFGAFSGGILVGFASVENIFFGLQKEYLQLSNIHVSHEKRGQGIGKELFKLICKRAIEMQAKKLYISAHSSEESRSYYKSIGCVEALEVSKELAEEEPCDCQLEYSLI